MTPNQKAFLDTIAVSEIGQSLLDVSDNGYNVLVGSTPITPLLFTSYNTHPHVLNAALNSTAAGRYQILFKNYVAYKIRLDLPDFSPDSQDAIALQMVKECGAFDDIEAGNLSVAIIKCSHIWASLPGSPYGQHENKMSALQEAFTNAGGSVA